MTWSKPAAAASRLAGGSGALVAMWSSLACWTGCTVAAACCHAASGTRALETCRRNARRWVQGHSQIARLWCFEQQQCVASPGAAQSLQRAMCPVSQCWHDSRLSGFVLQQCVARERFVCGYGRWLPPGVMISVKLLVTCCRAVSYLSKTCTVLCGVRLWLAQLGLVLCMLACALWESTFGE